MVNNSRLSELMRFTTALCLGGSLLLQIAAASEPCSFWCWCSRPRCPACPDDYCAKPLPCTCPLKWCGPDDYCAKPLPCVAPCYPSWYSCGPSQPCCGPNR